MGIQELHQRAVEAAKRFFKAEAELLDLIQKIDACKGFRDLGHASLFSYAVGELKLSESTALNLIGVARKAVQVPALKVEIQLGNLSVCKARKIVPVLNIQNQAEWIEKAKTLPARKLEKEIARVAPQALVPDRVRYLTQSKVALTVALDEKTMEAIKRVQDLESQRKGRPVTLEEALVAMSALFLERNDPVEKAKRAAAKISVAVSTGKVANTGAVANAGAVANVGVPVSVVAIVKNAPERSDVTWHTDRIPIPAATEHDVTLRDGAQCTAVERDGRRCEQRKWLHVHHIRPVSMGGGNFPENLTTLCSAHHRMRH